MNRTLSINSWTQPFPHTEGVAVVFDIFRCSTTIYCLNEKRNGPLFVSPSLKQIADQISVREMRIFSELSQPVDCLERFDNSPDQAQTSEWKSGLTSLVATTTGTPAMFAAKNFRKVYVGSLVGFSTLIQELATLNEPITLIPAALPNSGHVEDEIAAQAVATAIEGFSNIPDFVNQCAAQAKEKIMESGRPEFLSKKLSTGYADTQIAMTIDHISKVLSLRFKDSLFAEVI